MFFNFFVWQKYLILFFFHCPSPVPKISPKSVRSPLGLSFHLEHSFFRIINIWSFLEFSLTFSCNCLLLPCWFNCSFAVITLLYDLYWFTQIQRIVKNWPMVCLPTRLGRFVTKYDEMVKPTIKWSDHS